MSVNYCLRKTKHSLKTKPNVSFEEYKILGIFVVVVFPKRNVVLKKKCKIYFRKILLYVFIFYFSLSQTN